VTIAVDHVEPREWSRWRKPLKKATVSAAEERAQIKADVLLRRPLSRRPITIDGETKLLADWAKHYGITPRHGVSAHVVIRPVCCRCADDAEEAAGSAPTARDHRRGDGFVHRVGEAAWSELADSVSAHVA
jgi:hypothetical protein